MKIRNILAVFIILLTLAFLAFAWPGTDVTILGQKIDWNGLNLSTITDGRVEGELQFGNSLDLRGGEEYVFTTDLSAVEEIHNQVEGDDQKSELVVDKARDYGKAQAEKFAERLKLYGYTDYKLQWWVENESLNLDLLISQKNDYDQVVIPLLASKGHIVFLTQDPTYQAPADDSAETETYTSPSMEASFTVDDLVGFESVYSQNTPRQNDAGDLISGYGFKLKFTDESFLAVQVSTLGESDVQTQMQIDGQIIAQRVMPVDAENNTLYMNTLYDSSFAVNDAVTTVHKTGELDQELGLQAVNSVGAVLGTNYEWDLKLALTIVFILANVLFIFRYRILGIYFAFSNSIIAIWTFFLLKLTSSSLNLPLVVGFALGLIINIMINIDLLMRLKDYETLTFKKISSQLKALRPGYRNFLILTLTISVAVQLTQVFELSQLAQGLGVSILVSLLMLHILTETLLPQIYILQEKYANK